MSFTQAIRSGFANYVNFQGRAVASEFWWWQLFVLLVAFASHERLVDRFETQRNLPSLA